MRLIDADALREKALPASKFDPEMLVVGLGYVFSSPTIDTVKHGRWIMNSDRPDCIICSICDAGFDVWKHESKDFNFCPHCGANMEGVDG